MKCNRHIFFKRTSCAAFAKGSLLKKNILLFLIIIFTQCNRNAVNEKQHAAKAAFNEKVKRISKDFSSYYNYRYYNIKLSRDFVGIDSSFTPIEKGSFLRLLLTGEFMPVKIDTVPTYMLFKMPGDANPEIIRDIKYYAGKTSFYMGMEGKPMPTFNFKDINGDAYSNAFFKGKIAVIKCWYISCVACIKEFPELNKLVEQNKPYKDDIVFISFAFDSKERLKSFLSQRKFDYLVIPDAEDFISDALHVDTYPTHILLDKKGKVVTYVNDVHDLIPALEKLKNKGK
ncbi:TlpA disulfide reductase family protein [Agriterribacter sp.]|uniref:TlpA family protein disulfide reductase n=1 Tax=Agriterribacter sp. TaxID=2821509 RepID=UPI002D13A70E|nr:TlpA disulfide reductase family protein [Agriterribacter sp.]HTN07846.1 TlpA disulfide reductase family protein [Agriterribacter sp.]